jgi:hypothetical protein
MRHSLVGKVVLIVLLLSAAALAGAQTLKGPVSDKPIDEKWAPSKWGANDRAGSANHTKNSANIARALATIKQNKSLTIGKYYHSEAPAFGARLAHEHSRHADRRALRQERAHLPRRARDRRDRARSRRSSTGPGTSA